MRLLVAIFFPVALLTCNKLSAQADTVYTSLEDALEVHPDSVFNLDLSKTKFDSFPIEIFKFSNLTELSLSKCHLAALPPGFGFKNLKKLDLSKNSFTEIPVVVCNISSLRKLSMGRNKMTGLPECISQLKELDTLDVWFNNITEIPESITQMRGLKFLDLRGMNYTSEFQQKWQEKLPWMTIEFNLGCDCGH